MQAHLQGVHPWVGSSITWSTPAKLFLWGGDWTGRAAWPCRSTSERAARSRSRWIVQNCRSSSWRRQGLFRRCKRCWKPCRFCRGRSPICRRASNTRRTGCRPLSTCRCLRVKVLMSRCKVEKRFYRRFSQDRWCLRFRKPIEENRFKIISLFH